MLQWAEALLGQMLPLKQRASPQVPNWFPFLVNVCLEAELLETGPRFLQHLFCQSTLPAVGIASPITSMDLLLRESTTLPRQRCPTGSGGYGREQREAEYSDLTRGADIRELTAYTMSSVGTTGVVLHMIQKTAAPVTQQLLALCQGDGCVLSQICTIECLLANTNMNNN